MMPPTIEELRYFLKDSIRRQINFAETAQHRGVPPPPLEKPFPPEAERIDLPRPGQWHDIGHVDLSAAIARRESHRTFQPTALQLDELAFLLWATQGVRRELAPGTALRTVPSAGCRHALETYICALRVAGLKPGVYRYLPLEHQLVCEFPDSELVRKLHAGTLGQAFVGTAAAVFVVDGDPLPHGVALRPGRAQGHRHRRRPRLPKPLPRLRGHQRRHLRRGRLSSRGDGPDPACRRRGRVHGLPRAGREGVKRGLRT